MLILNDLSKSLVELTGCQPAEADDFLRELFALAAETLEAEGRVEVPLLGLFTVKDGAIHFQPDAELASQVNTPFADFMPIEVPEGFALGEEENPLVETVETSEIHGVKEERLVEPENVEIPAYNHQPVQDEDMPEIPPYIPPVREQEPAQVFEPEPVRDPEPDHAPIYESEKQQTRRALWCCRGMLIGLICAIIGFVAGWFVSQYYSPKEKANIVVSELEPLNETIGSDESDLSVIPASEDVSVDDPEQVEIPRPIVTDTVRVGRYLTTMAYEHYGQKEYWVYIYEANKQYGNPNTLSAGTVLVIPPADSLGLIPGDEEKLAEAQRKLNEIWFRFN